MPILILAVIFALIGILGGNAIIATFSLMLVGVFALGLLFINPALSIVTLIAIIWAIKQLSNNKDGCVR